MGSISVNEAASRLGLAPKTARRLIRRGQLLHARPVGRAIREPEDALAAILAQQAPGSTVDRRAM